MSEKKTKYAYLSQSENSIVRVLHILENKNAALAASCNGKVTETTFPEIQGYPCDGTKAKQTSDGLGWDYSKCKIYNEIKSPEDGYKINKELGDLYKSVM